MINSERRMYKRLYLTLPGELEINGEGDASTKRVSGAVRAISPVAALVDTKDGLKDGEKGVLELILPTDLGPRIKGFVSMHVPGGVVFKFNREQGWVMGLL